MRFIVAWLFVVALFPAYGQCDEPPKLSDPRLTISLFATDPQIVTPIGMAIDTRDRIFVIESHTHHPPADYAGPDTDRIKVFVDSDFDGKVDKVTIFADGLRQAMNLAFSPDGVLYVVCAREVLRLQDTDGDGVCDQRQQVAKLTTKERYAHNSLLGITFGRDGWMYVARGNTGSRYYRFESSAKPNAKDLTRNFVEGYGDGGSVIRCRPDGTQIEEFATGFWNPFDLKFDRNGRLLLVDNDPDARGPNRLLQVVRHGDYGYKSLFGGSGNHPFQGWDGSLPSTLPFIAGTGEAPSGLMDCRRSCLPAEYQNSVLATIWNENSIERFELVTKNRSPSLKEKTVFLRGGKDFRPVAIDCDSRGNLYVTDWVLVDYPNHGRGKIWRIVPKSKHHAQQEPQAYFDAYEATPSTSRVGSAARNLEVDLLDDDPFVVHEAIVDLGKKQHAKRRTELLQSEQSSVRLGALLSHRKADSYTRNVLQAALADPDEDVRIAALLWSSELRNAELRPLLDLSLRENISARLFDCYLAAVECLEPSFIAALRDRTSPRANKIQRETPVELLMEVVSNADFPSTVRALAVKKLDAPSLQRINAVLRNHLMQHDDELSKAIVGRCFTNLDTAWTNDLIDVALDSDRSTELRCEALLALSFHPIDAADRIRPLLKSASVDIAIEVGRTLRAWQDPASASVQTLVKQSDDQLRSLSFKEGSKDRGRRVFLSKSTQCSRCHTIGGTGGTLGPDLSNVGQSKSREQIVDAILTPSAQFPPQYQAWLVVTNDGQIHRGLQLDHKAQGAIELIDEFGKKQRFESDEIETYEASPTSLMPDGLELTLTAREFQDLVTFLTSCGE